MANGQGVGLVGANLARQKSSQSHYLTLAVDRRAFDVCD